MLAIWMLDRQRILCPIERKDPRRRRCDPVDALPLEICIAQRRHRQKWARGQRRHHIVKIKGDVRKRIIKKLRHITIGSPPINIPVLVVLIRIKTATGNHRLDPRIEHRRINRIVPTQRMSDRAKTTRRHTIHLLQ